MSGDICAVLKRCPAVGRVELVQPGVVLVEVETVKGTTLPLPGIDLAPRVEEIDRFTPWLDRCLRHGDFDLAGTIPKSYRLKRQIRHRDTSVMLHLCLPPRQWGIMAATLGSPERFAKRLVTSRLHGGWLPDGWRIREEGVVARSDGGLVAAPEEEAFFAALGLPFVPRAARR